LVQTNGFGRGVVEREAIADVRQLLGLRMATHEGRVGQEKVDQGRTHRRGERVAVDEEVLARLRHGPLRDQFSFLRDRARLP
jgi:hypothetical protein